MFENKLYKLSNEKKYFWFMFGFVVGITFLALLITYT